MVVIVDPWVVDKIPALTPEMWISEGVSRFAPYYAPNDSFSTISFNSSSDPDEYGICWIQPFDATTSFFFIVCQLNDVSNDVSIIFKDMIGEADQTITIEPDFATSAILSMRLLRIPLPETRLYEGRKYTLSIRPTTTGDITIPTITYSDPYTRETSFGCGYLCYRTDAGGWKLDTSSAIGLTPIMNSWSAGRNPGKF
jgi:hypothetical protein